jgi:hypothetical protein
MVTSKASSIVYDIAPTTSKNTNKRPPPASDNTPVAWDMTPTTTKTNKKEINYTTN